MSLLRLYLLQVHKDKHQFLTARSSFLSKLDEITPGMLITYHFYKIPTDVCRLLNFHIVSLHEELF